MRCSNQRDFDDVPIRDYIDSIWNDIADAEDEITDNPMYIILNLARVLAYVKDGEQCRELRCLHG